MPKAGYEVIEILLRVGITIYSIVNNTKILFTYKDEMIRPP